MSRGEINAQYRQQMQGLIASLVTAGWTQGMIATYRSVTTSCVSSWARGASTGTHADRDDLRLAVGAPLAASVALRLGGVVTRLESALENRQAALAEALKEQAEPSKATRAKYAAWGFKTDAELTARCAHAVRSCESAVKSTKRALGVATKALASFKALVAGKAVRS